jgi:retinol dehydrogenase-12
VALLAVPQTPFGAHERPTFIHTFCLPAKIHYILLTSITMGGFFEFLWNQWAFKPQPVPTSQTLEGKTILITGANIGLGFEAARELATHKPSRLILGVRNAEKGETAKESILKTSPEVEIDVWTLNYNSYNSLIAFAKRVASLDHLDYVLLNAGIKMMEYEVSDGGHEMNVQINHLGTSLLSILLLPTLQTSAKVTGKPSRLTIVTSEGHFWVPFHERTAPNILARMDEKETFGVAMQRYYTSKLLNVLWTRELAGKIDSKEIIINTVNPGFCYSGLHRNEKTGIIKIVLWLFGWTSEQGGHCLADALVEHEDSHGQYLSLQKIMKCVFPSPS